MSDAQGLEQIVEALEAYLAHHPGAMDSPRGIREWWFRDTPLRPDPDTLRHALEMLAARGRMVCETLSDDSEIWRGAPDT